MKVLWNVVQNISYPAVDIINGEGQLLNQIFHDYMSQQELTSSYLSHFYVVFSNFMSFYGAFTSHHYLEVRKMRENDVVKIR